MYMTDIIGVLFFGNDIKYASDINGFLFFVLWLIALYLAAGFGFWIGDYFQRLESDRRKAQWAKAKKNKKTLNKD